MSDLDKLLERAECAARYRGDSDAQLIYDLAAAVRELREELRAVRVGLQVRAQKDIWIT